MSFTLFLDRDDHEGLKDDAKNLGMSLQQFIQHRAIHQPASAPRSKADFMKPQAGKKAAFPVQTDIEVESLTAEIRELEARSPGTIDLETVTDQRVVDAAVPILHNVAKRKRLMLYLDAGKDEYIPISTVRLVGVVSGGEESIFLGNDERIVEKADEGSRKAELATLRDKLHLANLRISELAVENAKLLSAHQRLQEANQGLAEDNQKIRADRSHRLQKLQDEITRLTAEKTKALKSAV